MRKTLLGLGLVGMALVLSGCGQQSANQTVPAGQEQSNAQNDAKTSQKDNSIISSIKDAMVSGKQMKCNYSTTVNGGTIESTVYVEGNKFRMTSVVAGKSTNILSDGDTTYTWMEGQTTGTKMTMSCINDLKTSIPQGQASAPAVQSPENQFKDATKVSCVASSDADFSVPANVNFADQCDMLKKNSAMTKNIPTNIPANVPNMPNIPKY